MGWAAITEKSSASESDGEAPRTPSTVLLLTVALVMAFAVPTGVSGVAVAVDDPDEREASVAALQTGPTASLAVTPNPANPGEQVTFDATASTASEGDSVEQCEFDTDGDGTFETTRQTCQYVRSYETTAEYNVSVRIHTTADRNATDTETLIVSTNEAPVATISVSPRTPRQGEAVTLSAVDSSDLDGDVVGYRWIVDGRTVAESADPSFETAFESTGVYEVGLVVEDDDGAEGSTAASVDVVENRPPTAVLAASSSEPVVGEAIEFDASNSTDPESAIVAYRWDLDGDGAIDRETESARTSVTFEEAGQRSVRVVVVDDREDSDAATLELVIENASGGDRTGTVGTPVTTGTGANAAEGSSGFGPLDSLDFGIVPFLPDVLVLLVLLGVIGTAAVVVRRRDAVVSRIEDLRERVHRGDVRRKAGKKATGTIVKTTFKKIVRKLADGVEASGDVAGGFFEWIGRAIRRVADRVADLLRRIGG